MTNINDLDSNELFSGIFALIFVFISIFIGLLFIIKYFKTKRFEQLTLGLTWILISSAWWGHAFSFLSILFFEYAFQTVEFLFVSNVFFPLSILFWIYSFFHIFYQNQEKLVTILTTLILVPVDIVLICMIFIDSSLVGELDGFFEIDSGLFLTILTISILSVAFILGMFFSITSIKHDDSIIKKRGIILLVAFCSLLIGGVGIELFEDDLLLIIARIIMLTSAIEYYIAFFIGQRK